MTRAVYVSMEYEKRCCEMCLNTSMCLCLLAVGIWICCTKTSLEYPVYTLKSPQDKYQAYELFKQTQILQFNSNIGLGIALSIVGFFGVIITIYIYNKETQIEHHQKSQNYSQLNQEFDEISK
ncbi:Hypothetical_protein [Hexamita inflata]|uniref:Hypothetical_protein n=1 Tax=Hexamita inflata TaxID=28002 RepID=A0AA86QFX3_9EUKA|nr:Hypothetical protein HINF_LOCUS41914 [Hexamita inflata]CAI9954273.1 Hypothetical protein HINF_LOCUS41918 [Hexamita inflata]